MATRYAVFPATVFRTLDDLISDCVTLKANHYCLINILTK